MKNSLAFLELLTLKVCCQFKVLTNVCSVTDTIPANYWWKVIFVKIELLSTQCTKS